MILTHEEEERHDCARPRRWRRHWLMFTFLFSICAILSQQNGFRVGFEQRFITYGGFKEQHAIGGKTAQSLPLKAIEREAQQLAPYHRS
jgi:hypothetical protein